MSATTDSPPTADATSPATSTPQRETDTPASETSSPPPSASSESESTVPQPSEDASKQPVDPFASIYSKSEKWIIVSMISMAGTFSPLTANIYLPAIPSVAAAFHKSVELINLTVTVYIIFQGISPMFWGTISDSRGRRPMFIACLLLLSLSCVGLALVPTSDYWLLMLLRCVQSAGSASTVALGAGVIGDITRPEERAGMYGVYGIGALFGPAIGPVIGGVMDDRLGWRAIFWFMCIASGVCAILLILFLPETLRVLVGDGSIPPSRLHSPVIRIVGRHLDHKSSTIIRPKPKPWVNPLPILLNPDIVLLLCFSGVAMCMLYGITTTTSALFQEAYPFLSVSEIGYTYLAIAGSMGIGTFVSGKVLDLDYRRIKAKLEKRRDDADKLESQGAEKKEAGEGRQPAPLDFPLEYARLRTTPIFCFLMMAASIVYGWCIDKRVSLAVPLLCQVVFGICLIYVMNALQTLLIDLMPNRGSSITACNNLVRCSTSAVLVSIIQPIMNGIGTGWTFTLLAALGALGALMLLIVIKIGPKCRKRRAEKEMELADKEMEREKEAKQ